jgi:hypothetical protein
VSGYYDNNMGFHPYPKSHQPPSAPPPQPTPPAKVEAELPSPKTVVVSDKPFTTAPPLPDEAQFVEINKASRDAYKTAGNDMAKGATRPDRGRKLCQMFGSGFRVKDWTGTIKTLSSNGDGKGVLSISLGNEIFVKTWNNSFSDIGSDTLLEPGSEVYSKAVALQKGQSVRFSGSFIRKVDSVDCISEGSMTMNGSMTEPEYVFRFTDLLPN